MEMASGAQATQRRRAIVLVGCMVLIWGIMHLTYHDSKPHTSEASPAKAEGAGAPGIEITPEMIEAGLQYLYGAEPFCGRPGTRQELIAALKMIFTAMYKASQAQHFEA